MPQSTQKPDLGRANAAAPDRGAPSGHTPTDHDETHGAPRPASGRPDNEDPTEKARPRDTNRGGA
jgi:hypothetical protein